MRAEFPSDAEFPRYFPAGVVRSRRGRARTLTGSPPGPLAAGHAAPHRRLRPHGLDDARVGGHDRVAHRAVDGEVVLAAEPVIVHAGAVRHAGVNAGIAAVFG